MAAPILLSEYKMKKPLRKKHPLKESEIPVDLATLREFRAEVVGKLDGLTLRMDSFEKRMDAFEKRMDSFEKRMDSFEDRMKAFEVKMESLMSTMVGMIHEHKLLLEESRLRNKQAYDGYAIMFEKMQNLESRIKPECLID